MNVYQKKRMLQLLKATKEILDICNESPEILDPMAISVSLDNEECDGHYLLGCIDSLFEDLRSSGKKQLKSRISTIRNQTKLLQKNENFLVGYNEAIDDVFEIVNDFEDLK